MSVENSTVATVTLFENESVVVSGTSESAEDVVDRVFIHYPRGATIFASIAAISFVLIGVTGNLITVLALWRSAKLRAQATTLFVISLAASDLIFCAFNLTLTATRYISEAWILGDTLCEIFPVFFYGNVAASLLSMVAITLCRWTEESPSAYLLLCSIGLGETRSGPTGEFVFEVATTLFVISLAASDLIFCAFNLTLTATRYISEAWILGDTLCEIFPVFFYGNVAASLLSMVAITLCRYVLITHPDRYGRIFQIRNVWCTIAVVWIFSYGIMLPPLFKVWGRLGLDPRTFSCTILKYQGQSPKKFLFLTGILIPCLVIISSYTCIFWKVRRSRRNVRSHGNQDGFPSKTENRRSSIQRKEDLRMTKMMLSIFIAFIACFIPLMVVNVADDDVHFPIVHVMASVLAWASAVINPFIYAFSNRLYRSAFKKLLNLSEKPRSGLSTSGKTFLTEMKGQYTQRPPTSVAVH
ncbi:unnamed protein product [Cyprideis torosa]|uniref:Uncharacterized protein n=1 Tax=Cyprideis torosa TaxID=163714 RepID=A0A7R8WER5_9CRUS|nr:unnamed protein product [Cyprideis torosa]CAG0890640.1 unnamed protein product [Cyprideis torosa]